MVIEIRNNVVTEVTLADGETDVDIPDGVTEIGWRAFDTCSAMTSVTIPDSVTQIDVIAFIYCAGLTKLYLPDSVTDIGSKAFAGCNNLITNRSIKQWDNKYGISKLDYALNYMRHYQSGDPFFDDVKAENDRYIKAQREKLVRKITVRDAAAVSYMTREGWLSADNIDYLLDKTGGNVEITAMLLDYKHKNFTDEYLEQRETDKFEKEAGIKEHTLAEWKKIYQLGEDAENGGYILKKYNGTETEIIIPDHIAGKPVTKIGKRCFSPISTTNCEIWLVREKIRSIYIPDTVTCIEDAAFYQCLSLAEITIPNSVVSIGNYAFNQCQSLTGITLPESLVSISDGLFNCCGSLIHVQIPKRATRIGMDAFCSCTKLAEIDIPDNVKEIDIDAFAGCYSLKKVTLHKGLKMIGDSSFISCVSLTEIEIPESVTSIQPSAFSGCTSLTEITIPKGIKTIEFSTFETCRSLERVNLPDGLEIISHFAFAECPNLHEITIPASVMFLHEMSFWMTNVVITAARGSYAIRFAKNYDISYKEI